MTEEPVLREVAVAVVVHEGRVLVQTRAGPGRYQGYWEFPGGGREPGETVEQCAQRETQEEVGLGITVLGPLDHVEWSYPGVRVRVDFLLCAAVDREPWAEGREGQEVRWVGPDALGSLRFLPANAGIVESLRERLATS
jgi:8-oxo-dGTP diphosphatase